MASRSRLIIFVDHRNNNLPCDPDYLHECILDSHSPYHQNFDNKLHLYNRRPCHSTDLHNLDDSELALAWLADRD